MDDHNRQFEFQNNEFIRQQEQISSVKSLVAEQIGTVASDFSLQFNEFKAKDMIRDNKISVNSALIEAHAQNLKEFQIGLEKQAFMVQSAYDGVAQIRGVKLDTDIYSKDLTMVKRELTGNRYSTQDINNRLKETDNYIEKYLPIKMQNMLSQTLHKILKYDEEVKLCLYEEDKFQELHNQVLKDNGIPSLRKKSYLIPEIVLPERPPSSRRQSKFSKKASTRRLGSGHSGRSKGQGSTVMLSRSRQNSMAVPSSKEQSSGQVRERHQSMIASRDTMYKASVDRNSMMTSKESLRESARQEYMRQGIRKDDSHQSLTVIHSPIEGASIETKSPRMEDQEQRAIPSREKKQSKFSRKQKGKYKRGGASPTSKPIRIEDNFGGEREQGATTELIYAQTSDKTTSFQLEQEKQLFSVDVSIESRRRNQDMSQPTPPQYGYEAANEQQAHQERAQEEDMHEDDESGYYSEDQGVVISEGFVDDILERAEAKAKQITEAAIEAAFVERNYDFKIDHAVEKNETSIETLKKDIEEKLVQREKTILTETNELKQYVKTLQTDIEEEVKRRKRDKSDMMLETAELQKDTNINGKDLDEIKDALKVMGELMNILAQICQIECQLESQDEEDRKSIALMGVKEQPALVQQPARDMLFTPSTTDQRVQTAIPMARNQDESVKKNLPCKKKSVTLSYQGEQPRESPFECRSTGMPLISFQTPQYFQPRPPKKPVVNMDLQALAASGSPNLIHNMFKMACLGYSPTQVHYRGRLYDRKQLINLRGKMLSRAWNAVRQQQFSWSPIKLGRSPLQQLLQEDAQNQVTVPSMRDAESPTNLDILNATRSTNVTPLTRGTAKFDAVSLSQTSPGGMDGYLANAASRQGAQLNRNSLKEKTKLLMIPNKGNIMGEMSLRRLKAQMKSRRGKRNEENPRSIRSISIGIEGESSVVHHHHTLHTFAKQFLKQEQTQTTLDMKSPPTPLRPRIHGMDKRPVSKQSSSGGGVYIPSSQLDPKYEAYRGNMSAMGARKYP